MLLMKHYEARQPGSRLEQAPVEGDVLPPDDGREGMAWMRRAREDMMA